MDIVHPAVNEYLASLAPSRHPVLVEMERIAEEEDFPIIGPLCGRILFQLALAIGAKRVFELGSGYGYSAFWFASAVGDGGQVVHTDRKQTNSDRAREFLSRAGLADRVVFEVGDALEIFERYPGLFDAILLDLDKPSYPRALRMAKKRLRPGGLILTDNVLSAGRVTRPTEDDTTRAIIEYNKLAYEDPELVTTILPIRDGLAVSLKVVPGRMTSPERDPGGAHDRI